MQRIRRPLFKRLPLRHPGVHREDRKISFLVQRGEKYLAVGAISLLLELLLEPCFGKTHAFEILLHQLSVHDHVVLHFLLFWINRDILALYRTLLRLWQEAHRAVVLKYRRLDVLKVKVSRRAAER